MTTDDGMVAAPTEPHVLISYAHTGEVPAKVWRLAEVLREEYEVNVEIDQYELPNGPDEGWPDWMERMVRDARHIVCVCTPDWADRVEMRAHIDIGKGVKWEGSLIRNMLYRNGGISTKVVLVQLEGEDYRVPEFLFGRHYHALPEDMKNLVDTLHGKKARRPTRGARKKDGDAGGLSAVETPSQVPLAAETLGGPQPKPDAHSDQGNTPDPAARAEAERKVRAQLSGNPVAARQLAKAASLPLDPTKEIGDQLDPLVRHVLVHDVAAVLLAMERAWTDCGPADRLAVAACAGARLELDAALRPELTVVREVVHRQAADRKLKVPTMNWPLTIGFVNARAHGLSARVAPAVVRDGVEPVVEGTHVWDEEFDLPVLATLQSSEVNLAEWLGADLGTYRQHRPPEGRSAIERIVAAKGGSRLRNVDLLIRECKRILSEGRQAKSDAFRRTIIVVDVGGYDSAAEATAAFDRAVGVVGVLFQDSAPPVFFLTGSEATVVEATINEKMRAMLAPTPS
ncbi:MAG: toll/interleukin-1 receptor domain-containing protein [Deltaproteobacteria bacterium]|nr:toll/interleukin-1 receptor domain-containing protein [Deltaproteobacteria bacterium]